MKSHGRNAGWEAVKWWQRVLFTGCLATLGSMLSPSPVRANDYFEVGAGADYSVGDYGDVEDTEILFLTASAKLRTGGWTLRASLPYIHVKGPGNIIPSEEGVIPGITRTPVVSRQGMGDIAFVAEHTFRLGDRTFVDLIGRIKLPTASAAKGLGTGTTSVTASAELTRVIGPVILTARAGRRFNGSSEAFRQRDVWEASSGVIYVDGGTSVGLFYDWRAKVRRTSAPRSEMTAFITRKLSPKLQLQGYVTVGLTNGSPDRGGGLVLVNRFSL